LGRPLGLGSAFMAMLAYGFLLIGIYLYAGVVYQSLVSHFFNATPYAWWTYSLALMALVSVLGYLSISLSAKVLTIALICEVLLVFVWEAAIAITNGPSALSPSWLTLRAATSGSIGVGLLLGVTSFAGFEATAVFREEARDPQVTVPRATYLAVIVLSVLFASAAYFFICGYGPAAALTKSRADPSMAALDSIGLFLGRFGRDAVNLLLCTSVFACSLALHNILARYIYCLGIDNTLPRSLGAVHTRHGSPYRASALVSILMLVTLAGLVEASIRPYVGYGALTGTGGYVLLILLVLTSLSVVVFFQRTPVAISRWKTAYAPLISFFLLVIVGVFATLNLELLTGSLKVAVTLLLIIGAILLAGCGYAVWLRTQKPHVYLRIGRQNV
jgi:amino acid transporter